MVTALCVIPILFILPICCKVLEFAKDLAWFHRRRLEYRHAKRQKIGLFGMRKVARAIRPLTVQCGPFREVNREFVVDHFRQSCDRIFDAIILL